MARPKHFRTISTVFTDREPGEMSSQAPLRVEELEALRLVDLEGMRQEDAAKRMAISRQTVGRILASGRRTVAEALVHGRVIRIAGGVYRYAKKGMLTCPHCRHRQPIVRTRRDTIPCRRCCHPVQGYGDPGTYQNKNEDPMDLTNAKIAVASDDGKNVSSHFGRAPYYAVLTMKDGNVGGVEQRLKFAPHAAGGEQTHDDHSPHAAHHHAMVNPILDCQVVVARGMGDGAYIHLAEAGLTVILSDLHSVDEIAAAARSGSLIHQPARLHKHGMHQ